MASAVNSRECTNDTWIAMVSRRRQDRPHDRGLRPVAGLQRPSGVDGQLRDAGGAGRVGDQRRMVGRHDHRGHPRRARRTRAAPPPSRGCPRSAARSRRAPNTSSGSSSSSLSRSVTRCGRSRPADQLGDRRTVQLRRQQHRDRTDPGGRAREQRDVEAVGLVDDHPLAGAHVRRPQPRGEVGRPGRRGSATVTRRPRSGAMSRSWSRVTTLSGCFAAARSNSRPSRKPRLPIRCRNIRSSRPVARSVR